MKFGNSIRGTDKGLVFNYFLGSLVVINLLFTTQEKESVCQTGIYLLTKPHIPSFTLEIGQGLYLASDLLDWS